jgi:Zn-dependent peptidase ImmA (M78 family)
VIVLETREELGEFVDDELLTLLLEKHARTWSGMTIPCDGEFVVVMNMTHARTRQNATLMEELFHIILKHKPSKIGTCPHTGMTRPEYNRAMEREAYNSAAAALVPYSAMKKMVLGGANAANVAAHFEVSTELVTFRMKTCRLYRRAS